MGLFRLILSVLLIGIASNTVQAKQPLRILSWEGYVTDTDIQAVNKLLDQQGYDYSVQVIEPLAEGASQMFDVIRANDCDLAFLTLFFIKMEREQTAKLLQPINTASPRLTNYKHLQKKLTHLEMGMYGEKPLYIPWGGGIYGFYANMDKVSVPPESVNDLWEPKWHKHYSLNGSQEWYNLGLSMMSLGDPPFYLNSLVEQGNRKKLTLFTAKRGELQRRLNSLYQGATELWEASPTLNEDLWVVSSWGPEIGQANEAGGNWQLINFKEGNMIWLDTLNIVKGVTGKKLEAAEIFANYFIGKEVQERVVSKLSMFAASSLAEENPLIDQNEDFLRSEFFVPSFHHTTHNLMEKMVKRARAESSENP